MLTAAAFVILALAALSLLTGPWPPILVAAAFLILAAIFTLCVCGLIQQGLAFRYEERLKCRARIRELERELGVG